MPEHDPVPEADALEQSREIGDDEAENGATAMAIPPEVDEADALEQAPAPVSASLRHRERAEADEADLLEQERPASSDDEDERR